MSTYQHQKKIADLEIQYVQLTNTKYTPAFINFQKLKQFFFHVNHLKSSVVIFSPYK